MGRCRCGHAWQFARSRLQGTGVFVLRVLLATIVCLTAAAGCLPESPSGPGQIVIIDDTGDTTRLAQPATRVVSLVPAITELLFALGAGDQLVGRTSWGDYPPEALAVPDVGDGINPNLEAILGQTPDLVVLYHSAQNFPAATRLRELGIPALLLHVDLLDQVTPNAARLGRATGREAAADSLIEAFELALARQSAPIEADSARLFIMAWDQPPMTLGAGSFVTELVRRAGHLNVFGDMAAPSAPVALEAIAERDPDWIILLGDGRAAFLDRPEWQVISAVRQRRTIRLTGSQFEWPGPRSPAAIAELRNAVAEAAE